MNSKKETSTGYLYQCPSCSELNGPDDWNHLTQSLIPVSNMIQNNIGIEVFICPDCRDVVRNRNIKKVPYGDTNSDLSFILKEE